MSSAQSVASITGFSDPAAKGAMVSGTRPAETSLFGFKVSSKLISQSTKLKLSMQNCSSTTSELN